MKLITILFFLLLFQIKVLCQFNTITHKLLPLSGVNPQVKETLDSLESEESLKDSLSWKMVYHQFSEDANNNRVPNGPVKYYPPLHLLTYNSLFGLRFHPLDKKYKLHAGVDLKARYTSVYAISDGVVKVAGRGEKEGNYIIISHDEIESIYCHLAVILCQQGKLIKGGSCIAISGNTGSSTGPHLHFGMKYKGLVINPIIYLKNIANLND